MPPQRKKLSNCSQIQKQCSKMVHFTSGRLGPTLNHFSQESTQLKTSLRIHSVYPMSSFEETYNHGTLVEPHYLGSPIMKVLGVCWDTQEYKLSLCVSEISKAARVMESTKRNDEALPVSYTSYSYTFYSYTFYS